MANLNLPFVLFQPSICSFTPSISTSKLIPFNKYNILQGNPLGASQMKPTVPLSNNFTSSQINFGEGGLNGSPKFSPLDDTPKHLIVLCD